MRRASKVDNTQKSIVEGLRKCGYRVEIIKQPVDLCVMVGKNYWRLLEVKNRKRNDQPKQRLFLSETGTPVVSSVEEALEALIR
jgi:hypothetical protein